MLHNTFLILCCFLFFFYWSIGLFICLPNYVILESSHFIRRLDTNNFSLNSWEKLLNYCSNHFKCSSVSLFLSIHPTSSAVQIASSLRVSGTSSGWKLYMRSTSFQMAGAATEKVWFLILKDTVFNQKTNKTLCQIVLDRQKL